MKKQGNRIFLFFLALLMIIGLAGKATSVSAETDSSTPATETADDSSDDMETQAFTQTEENIKTVAEPTSKCYVSEEAILTIEEYTKIVINYVLAHNQDPDLNYPLTRDMIEDKKTDATPINLWHYWNSVAASPRPITSSNVLQFRHDLMLSFTAKVNNEGIHFIGDHIYDNFEDSELQTLKYDNIDRKTKFEVRYDPRNVNCIYYLRNNRLHFAKLNMDKQINNGFENLTFDEMKKLDSLKKQILSVNKVTHEEVRRNRGSANRTVVKTAIQTSTRNYANAKDMRINRESEKQDVRYSNSITSRILPEENIDISHADVADYVENTANLPVTTSQAIPDIKAEKNVMDMTDEELEEYEEQVNRRLNHIL